MRISGGLARGIILKSVEVALLRPATDYLRQAVFSSLGEGIKNCRFLDLFAGTGSYGLEALSRGAHSGVFVEYNATIVTILEQNLIAVCKSIDHQTCNLHDPKSHIDHRNDQYQGENRIWNIDAFKIRTEERFDLVFIDSPYDFMRERSDELLSLGARFLKNNSNSRLIIEIPGDMTLGENIVLINKESESTISRDTSPKKSRDIMFDRASRDTTSNKIPRDTTAHRAPRDPTTDKTPRNTIVDTKTTFHKKTNHTILDETVIFNKIPKDLISVEIAFSDEKERVSNFKLKALRHLGKKAKNSPAAIIYAVVVD